MDMTIIEAMDYVKAYEVDGITLTENGRNAAAIILERRAEWTDSHALMLIRINNGVEKLPHKLVKLVKRTRLGDALELARKLTRVDRRKEKGKLRRKAAKARKHAAMAAMERAAA